MWWMSFWRRCRCLWWHHLSISPHLQHHPTWRYWRMFFRGSEKPPPSVSRRQDGSGCFLTISKNHIFWVWTQVPWFDSTQNIPHCSWIHRWPRLFVLFSGNRKKKSKNRHWGFCSLYLYLNVYFTYHLYSPYLPFFSFIMMLLPLHLTSSNKLSYTIWLEI